MKKFLNLLLLTVLLCSPKIQASDSLDGIPEDAVVLILSFCDLQCLGRMNRVSTRYLSATEKHDGIWRLHLLRFPHQNYDQDVFPTWKLFIRDQVAEERRGSRRTVKQKLKDFSRFGGFDPKIQGLRLVKKQEYSRALAMFSSLDGKSFKNREIFEAFMKALGETRQIPTEEMRALGKELNWVDTRLIESVRKKDINLSKFLVSSDVNVDETDPKWGSTALMFAAQIGDPTHVKLLLDAGADMTLRSRKDAYSFAMEDIKLEVIQVFLNHGVPVDARDTQWGSTALMFAVQQVKPDLIRYLLSQGADRQLASLNRGITVFEFSQRIRRQVLREEVQDILQSEFYENSGFPF